MKDKFEIWFLAAAEALAQKANSKAKGFLNRSGRSKVGLAEAVEAVQRCIFDAENGDKNVGFSWPESNRVSLQ